MPYFAPHETENRSGDDQYLTPMWAVRMWKEHHAPALPERVVDLGCGDFRVGRAFDAMAGFDLNPLPPHSPRVKVGDIFNLTRADFDDEDISIVSNPPFKLVKRWLKHCLLLAGKTGDVSLLIRTGVVQQTSFAHLPQDSILPQKRMCFDITKAYYLQEMERQARPKEKKSSAKPCKRDCPTGYRLGSPSESHGIYTFTHRSSDTHIARIVRDCKRFEVRR